MSSVLIGVGATRLESLETLNGLLRLVNIQCTADVVKGRCSDNSVSDATIHISLVARLGIPQHGQNHSQYQHEHHNNFLLLQSEG